MSDELTPRERLRERARKTVWADAFFRWESAVTIALTMLLAFFVPQLPAPFEWWQWWYWLLAGLVVEAGLVLAHVTDPQSAQAAVARLFRREHDPRDIRTRTARQQLQKALDYRDRIADLVAQQSGALQMSLQQTLDDVDEWIAQVYRLARRMDSFAADSLLERDRRNVPNELRALRRRLETEESPTVRQELEDAIRLKEQQLANLKAVEDNMKRAGLQLDNTLAALGTLYAQVQVIDSKDMDSARARRLRDEIHDEVAELQDTILAMDEVYSTGRLRE
ncbi:MAG: hypothetical protein HPY64_10950 [Anaerolineae bacterium]|nr:hypothetical protein [Anaerolineae bacterium]